MEPWATFQDLTALAAESPLGRTFRRFSSDQDGGASSLSSSLSTRSFAGFGPSLSSSGSGTEGSGGGGGLHGNVHYAPSPLRRIRGLENVAAADLNATAPPGLGLLLRRDDSRDGDDLDSSMDYGSSGGSLGLGLGMRLGRGGFGGGLGGGLDDDDDDGDFEAGLNATYPRITKGPSGSSLFSDATETLSLSFSGRQQLLAGNSGSAEDLDFLRGGEQLTGVGFDSVCFTPTQSHTPDLARSGGAGNTAGALQDLNSASLSNSALFRSMIRSSQNSSVPLEAVHRQPHKALVTFNTRDKTILIVNREACTLFGAEPHQLVGQQLSTFLSAAGSHVVRKADVVADLLVGDDGSHERVSGRILNCHPVSAGGHAHHRPFQSQTSSFPVSVWMRQLPAASSGAAGERTLAVLERVNRIDGHAAVDSVGRIVGCDKSFAMFHGFECHELIRQHIASLLPALATLDPQGSSVHATSHGRSGGAACPCIVTYDPSASTAIPFDHFVQDERIPQVAFVVRLQVFAGLSGLVSFRPDGTVYGCNHSFMLYLFGWTEEQAKGRPVTDFLPDLYQQLPWLQKRDEGREGLAPPGMGLSASPSSPLLSRKVAGPLASSPYRGQAAPLPAAPTVMFDEPELAAELSEGTSGIAVDADHQPRHPGYHSDRISPGLHQRDEEEKYTVLGLHKDGAELDLTVQIKRVVLSDRSELYCAWITRHEGPDASRALCELEQSGFLNDACGMTGHLPQSLANRSGQLGNSSMLSPADQALLCTSPAHPFAQEYECLDEIGSGSFGHVQLAVQRASDRTVVVKFIDKAKVLSECWENLGDVRLKPANIPGDSHSNEIPREIKLMLNFRHENIVTVMEVFQDTKHYMMVMERHGPGFDMFEFIEANPDIDESVASYIFRQVVSAVDYLHNKNIVHRDIKDENIILDLEFRAKLIDFGSAAYTAPGKVFDTFCGTLEYCCPEVLLGNQYRGPELDTFALGVTLYTLLFGENPFFDVDETIAGVVRPPGTVSKTCLDIVLWMLEADPTQRASIPEVLQHEWITMDVTDRLEQILNDPEWLQAKQRAAQASSARGDSRASGDDGGSGGGDDGTAVAAAGEDSHSDEDELDEHSALYEKMFREDLEDYANRSVFI